MCNSSPIRGRKFTKIKRTVAMVSMISRCAFEYGMYDQMVLLWSYCFIFYDKLISRHAYFSFDTYLWHNKKNYWNQQFCIFHCSFPHTHTNTHQPSHCEIKHTYQYITDTETLGTYINLSLALIFYVNISIHNWYCEIRYIHQSVSDTETLGT